MPKGTFAVELNAVFRKFHGDVKIKDEHYQDTWLWILKYDLETPDKEAEIKLQR
jgi:hypothetical protein